MQIVHAEKLSKLNSRRLVPGVCQSCSRQFFYRRTGRPKNFCDQKCRQAEFQYRRVTPGIFDTKRDESGQKTQVNSKTFKADFADRPSVNRRPRWVDRELWHTIITIEIPERKLATLTPEQLQQLKDPFFQIPDDLSVPPFLKREPHHVD